MAANRILAAMERPDLADFEPLLDGQMSLRELRADGKDTALIKKCKAKRRIIPGRDGAESTEETEREIELHDRAPAAWRDIIDDTDGKPSQTINVAAQVQVVGIIMEIVGGAVDVPVGPVAGLP